MHKQDGRAFFAPQWAFTPEMVSQVPDLPGVFALWQEKELIYIGRAVRPGTLRGALQDHLHGLHGCTQRASHYAWQLALDPVKKERELLAAFHSHKRALPRCNRA